MKRAFSLLALTVLGGFGVTEARAATAETAEKPDALAMCNPSVPGSCRTPVAVTGVRG